MNLTQLSTVLEKLYNKLGNRYLTKNFITEPFEFKVNIKYDKNNDMYDYIIEVYSNPPMPESFKYRHEVREEQNKTSIGVHISVIRVEFKKMFEYLDINMKYVGVAFMNVV
jgi:beta-galactosidase/beta-glucuronidase